MKIVQFCLTGNMTLQNWHMVVGALAVKFVVSWSIVKPPVDSQVTLPGVVWCTLYSLQWTLYTVHCTIYNVQQTMYIVHLTVYSVQCTVHTVQCTVYSVHCVHCVHCTLYTVLDVLCPVSVTPVATRSRGHSGPSHRLTVLYCTALHCTAHCTALYCTTLNCTSLHCTLYIQCPGCSVGVLDPGNVATGTH